MNFKEVILSSDSLDNKVKKLSEFFESEEFINEALFSEVFLDIYIPFSILILNTFDPEKGPPYTTRNDKRTFILKSLNKLIYKNIKNQDFIVVLNRVLEKDNLHNAILALKIFASLSKTPIMTPEVVDRHVSYVVELINSIFHRLDTADEAGTEASFFALVQIFSYASDVIQRSPITDKKIDGIIHRAITFYRLFLEHRRIIEMIKYNKNTALEMISSLSKLFKMASESTILSQRNDVLNSTVFELSKFSLFYCPTDAIELRKELFFYIFKILLRNKEMYLPKIEELFDIRFFYLDESYLINIKGVIGLTDLASVFSDNLSRRVPHELQRRTAEVLENNLKMIAEKLESEWPLEEQQVFTEDEIKLRYEKSLKFHIEIVYECVNLIYKQTVILKKFVFQKVEFIDFSHKQFLLVSQIVNFTKATLARLNELKLQDKNKSLVDELTILVKSTFLALSKPLKELGEGLNDILKNNTDISIGAFVTNEEIYNTFDGVIETINHINFNDGDLQYLPDIILFFFTPFNGSLFIDLIKKLIVQLFKKPCVAENHLNILKKCSNLNLQIVANEIILQLANTITHDKRTEGLKNKLYIENINELDYAKFVKAYEPVFDFIADIYNINPAFIGKRSMSVLVNLIDWLSSSRKIEDHKLFLYLLGTFNIKNDKLGGLHVFFYKRLHTLVSEYYKFYTQCLDPLYLDIIFSLPININAISSEWVFLFNPIYSALKLRDEISVKAISTFIHIVETSKGEIIVGGCKREIETLLEEILNLLEDARFIIPCSQLLGRLKSFHKKYLTPSIFYFDDSFAKESVFLVSLGQTKTKIQIRNVVALAIATIRGSFVYDSDNLNFHNESLLTFRKTSIEGKRDPKDLQKAYELLKRFLFCAFRWDVYGLEETKHKMVIAGGTEGVLLSNGTEGSQLVYDSIISLFVVCDLIEDDVLGLLKDIYSIACLTLKDFDGQNLFFKSLVEGFGANSKTAGIILHYLLDKLGEELDCAEDLECILSPFVSYLVYLAGLRNEKMSLAAFNALNALLTWERLPFDLIVKDIKRVLDCLVLFVEKQKTFSKEYLKGISFIVNRSDTMCCLSFFFKWCVDRLTFNTDNKPERMFCKEFLKLLYTKHGNLFVAMFKEKLRGFFYALSDPKDIDLFFTKVDLFVFFVRHNKLFSLKETIVLVKTFFYYILSCNFLILNVSQEFYFTNLSIKSSEKFKLWEKNLFKGKEILKDLYLNLTSLNIEFYNVFDSFDVSEEEKYFYYLVNEIIFMHLAFIKNKEAALLPFSYVFSHLPFGLSTPLKLLYASNKSLVKDLLLSKYEECFCSTLSVQVVEKMITIFSVIEPFEDKRLLEFILKIFMECQTQVESLLFAEDSENSILAKTFELSLRYPEQSLLHSRILRMAYPWLFNSSKRYISSIIRPILDYLEQFSFLTFPFLVRECVDEAFFYLLEYATKNSVLFNNFVNNLSQAFIEECFEKIYNQDLKNNQKVLYFLKFLKLIDFDVSPTQINVALMIFSDLKMKNKDTQEIKKFLKFSINRFTEQDLNFLYKIDPLFKLNDACNVKLFQSLSSKPLFGFLLKSINKKDVMSFENLVRFYGEQSWMLIEVFVDVKFYSPNMIEYCKSNLSNINIRSFLLYYLCTFEPQFEYFEMLLNLSFEERKYTAYSLRKVVEKFKTNESQFEEIIISHLQSEIRYKTNIHVLYPLIVHSPQLLTNRIGRILIGITYRLLSTFIQFHQKIGTLLFNVLYDFYGFSPSLRKLHNLLFVNFIHTKKNNILPFLKDHELDLDEITVYPESFEINNLLIYYESEIASNKSVDYKLSLSKFVLESCRKEILKFPLKEATLDFLFDATLIVPKDLQQKEVNKTTLINALRKNSSLASRVSSLLEDGFPFPNLLEFFLSSPPVYFLDFLRNSLLNPEKKSSLKLLVEESLLDPNTPVCQVVQLLISLPSKNILPEEDLLDLTLSFFIKNKFKEPALLNNLHELFFRGLKHSNEVVRQKYIQFFNEILPHSLIDRLEVLLDLEWLGCPKKQVPFVIVCMLLESLQSLEMCLDGVCESSNALMGDFRKILLNFLFISPKACLSLLEEMLRNSEKRNLWKALSLCSPYFNDDLIYTLSRSLGAPEGLEPLKLKGGTLTLYYLLNTLKASEKLKLYEEVGNKDYHYGSLRLVSKFPETMQASLFQQFGDFKRAHLVYEKIQQECCEAKVSFYEDEYEILSKEWINCAREMQQWDVCYTLGKSKGDASLSADSLFYTSNFNNSVERESFLSMASLIEKGVKRSFYELLYSVYQTPTTESFVNLLNLITTQLKKGPRSPEFINYFVTLIQIVLEMHDTSTFFTLRPDLEERINSLNYVWEDKEPLLEDTLNSLVLFSTWRRHFFRRMESFSSMGGEDGESFSKLKKTMYIKANNGLGRNANFLALASFKKGYYDNALFLLKEVFELPSIKILDAYRKVIYELLCYYELDEHKLGLDLANSTNIVHFTEEQSSTIFRIRGMFSEKLLAYDEPKSDEGVRREDTKKLYFQAIQFFSSAENYFYYVNFLFRLLSPTIPQDPATSFELQNEIVSSTLSGLAFADSVHSKNLVMQFLLLLKTQTVTVDVGFFQSLLKTVHLPHFVFFIPQLVDLLSSPNCVYVKLILQELIKGHPQPVITQLRLRSKDYGIIKNEHKPINNLMILFEDLVRNKFDTPQHELIGLLEELIDYLSDSLGEVDLEKVKVMLNRIKELDVPDFEGIKCPSGTLSSIVSSLCCALNTLRKNLKPSEGVKSSIEKINRILLDKKMFVFGSFSKVQKDYLNCVLIESIDKNSNDLVLVGSDGRFYKVEACVSREPKDNVMIGESKGDRTDGGTGVSQKNLKTPSYMPALYELLSLELSNSYQLRSREAYLHVYAHEQFMLNITLDVFDTSFYAFDEICTKEKYLVEFIKAYEKESIVEDLPFTPLDLERNILNLLKPKIKESRTRNTISFNEFIKKVEESLSSLELPKLNAKLRLTVCKETITPLLDLLPSTFYETNSYSYFMLKNSFCKSFALNLSINNFLQIKTKSPRNDTIQKYTGLFVRKNLESKTTTLSPTNTLYISPGIQDWLGLESIEGPFLSCLYFSSAHLLKSKSLETLMRFFYAFSLKENVFHKNLDCIKEVVAVEGDDHQILKIVNNWTDVNHLLKNKPSENPWL